MKANNRKKVQPDAAQPKAGWRIKTGFTIFIVGVAWPILLPILPLFGISSKSVGTFTGVMLVAAEVMMLAAAAIAGKDGFAYIKKRVFGLLRSYGPPQVVSATRYRIGLAMFTLPLLFAFVSPYIGHYIAGLTGHRMVYGVAGDILMLVGLFVLGGDFWDKLRSLYVHTAVVVMPETPAK